MATVAGNVRDVAILVDGLAVFISAQIGAQIYGLAAKYAGYFWVGAAAHQCLLGRQYHRRGKQWDQTEQN